MKTSSIARRYLLLAATLFAAHAPSASAETFSTVTSVQLAELSLEELMNVQITSVSKQPERLQQAAAAIHVITRDDILRSGVTSLPEALRLAPGVQVSRMNANQWAISIRGFAGHYSNKLLVLQDGRTLYNSSYGGVYWNAQETMLEDVERVEVIRGPGATLWGSNAVNGVINIITRSSRETTGGLATASVGSWERGSTAVRYGGKNGDNGFLRIYGKYFYRDGQATPGGIDTEGHWDDWRSGFRGDWDITSRDSATVQGDLYSSQTGVNLYRGHNLLGGWQKSLSETSQLAVQLYYDHSDLQKLRNPQGDYSEDRNSFDAGLQHTFTLGEHQIVWGTGFRYDLERYNPDPAVNPTFTPTDSHDHLLNAFVQDRITLITDTLQLVVGSRFEHRDYTGWETQPTVRLLYTPTPRHTLWTAVTRALRTPSRAERTITADIGGPFILGNPTLDSERLVSYELGYRVQPHTTLALDLALFYNDYSRLVGLLPETATDLRGATTSTGIGRGFELSIDWHPLQWLNLMAFYNYLDLEVTSKNDPELNAVITMSATTPRHQTSLRTSANLPGAVTLDLWLRHSADIASLNVPDYTTMDVRIAWKPLHNLELSLTGQNLLEKRHIEFGTDFFGNPATMTERSLYGKAVWAF